MIVWPSKDPNEILEYSWTVPLDSGDGIATFAASLVAGDVVIDSSSHADGEAIVWLSGGTVASQVQLRVTTTGGRTFEETAVIGIAASASEFAASFKSVFSDFAKTASDKIDYWATRADRIVNDDFGDDKAHAKMLLTAHYLALQGEGGSVEAQRATQFAGATRVKSGDLELSWSDGTGTPSEWQKTRYGAELWPLIRAYRGGPRVASTGTYPVFAEPTRWGF